MSEVRQFASFGEITNFIWSVADLLRGDYKQSEYGKVILPLTVIRRLDCVLKDTKVKVLAKHEQLKGGQIKVVDPVLNRITGVPFHNISKLDFEKLKDDPAHIARNLNSYLKGFSENARDVIDRFNFSVQITKLDDGNLLYQVVRRFAEIDLHPNAVSNHEMGSVFEELIRRFSEASNETAGEHFTPREVIRLMVNLLFIEDDDTLRKKGVVKTLYDPACGTGGMLSTAEEYLFELNPQAKLEVFGQELNDESYAICKADMMIKGQNPENIKRGNSFSEDGHAGRKFDYMLSNPPFGVEWKKVEKVIRDEAESLGFSGRFGAGLPRINDGSLLFLQHMISKMRPAKEGGSRIAIVFNGSPLFAGDAGSGESEIRKWIIENDWLEAIVGLPDQIFYNTGISTYIWIVTNRKPSERKGKVQLINGTKFFRKMKRSLGDKRHELAPQHIDEVTRIYGAFEENEHSKLFGNTDFGYRRIVVERPLRLNFQFSRDRIDRLREESAFANLAKSKKKGALAEREIQNGVQLQDQILTMLSSLDSSVVYRNRDEFLRALYGAVADVSSRCGVVISLDAALRKAILAALSERDEAADVCVDSKLRPEPDAELRDMESVPLKEHVDDYFAREVKPHVPDAWVDGTRITVGYEIPFTRKFFVTDAARKTAAIKLDLERLESQISRLLGEVLN